MSRVFRSSLLLDRSPRIVRGRSLPAESAMPTVPSSSEADAREDATEDILDETAPPPVSEELRMLFASLENSIQEAEQVRRQSLEEFQQLAVELAVTIAGELVFRAIDADQLDVGGLVAAAVDRLGLDTPLTIDLHPSDLQLLESQQTADIPACRMETLMLRADAALPRGHCRATNGATVLLSEFAPRLEEIRDSLLEGLNDAQIERRQAAGIGATLKRFPDRRETA